MNFVFSEMQPIQGQHIFKKGEGLSHNLMEFCDFSLMTGCGYLGIDINTTNNNRIYGISGYISLKDLKQESVSLPSKVINGALFAISDCCPDPGTVIDYDDHLLVAKYDAQQRCIWLGDNNCNATAIKISNDTYISIIKNKIIAIFIKPIFV